MNSLEKKLVKIASDSNKESEEIVNDVKLLLESNVQEERNTLRSIGLDNDINFAESKQQDLIVRKKMYAGMGKEVLHLRDIDKLCKDYRLYLRPAKEYIGSIPPDLGAELNRFCKDNKIVLPSSSDYSKFFIIAPPKMFKGYDTPVRVVKRGFDKYIERVKEARRRRLEDPILVYELPERGYYAVIKSWGKDFTPLRRLYGMFTTQKAMKRVWWAFSFASIYGFYSGLSFWWNHFIVDDKNALPEIFFVFSCIAFVVGMLLWAFLDDARDFRRDIYRIVTENEYKRKKILNDLN